MNKPNILVVHIVCYTSLILCLIGFVASNGVLRAQNSVLSEELDAALFLWSDAERDLETVCRFVDPQDSYDLTECPSEYVPDAVSGAVTL